MSITEILWLLAFVVWIAYGALVLWDETSPENPARKCSGLSPRIGSFLLSLFGVVMMLIGVLCVLVLWRIL